MAGATGYAGQELVALLARHPHVDIRAAMSSSASSAARPLPRLARVFRGALEPLDPDKLAHDVDVAFLAVPEAASAEIGGSLAEAGVRVIDLSGAFRLKDPALRSRWYPATKAVPDGVAYGLVEHHRAEIKDAHLVACPGCYPTAALLSLLPLAKRACSIPGPGSSWTRSPGFPAPDARPATGHISPRTTARSQPTACSGIDMWPRWSRSSARR